MNLKKRKIKKAIPLPLLLITIFIIYFVFSIHGLAIDEYALKSTIIFKICKYTQWPQSPDKNKPFSISILGKTTPGKEIKIPWEKIDNRRVIIRKIRNLSEIGGSEVLFIASSEAFRIDSILDYIGNKPVLTVGDTREFGEKGVIINLYIHNDSVGFEINYEASKKAALQINSQLCTIGRLIRTKKSFQKDVED
jgi:hypothetical protein